ncbi:hypothetical protein SRHO_G00122650 [Serrasalmus rhombeus]
MARCSWFSITNSLIQRIAVAYGHTTLRTPPSRLISEAKQGRAWLVLGWETTWEYQSYPEHRCRLRPYHPENARSRLISEAKQGRAWLVLGWETTWEYQSITVAYGHTALRTPPSRLISEAKQGRAWLVLGWETTWEYQVL